MKKKIPMLSFTIGFGLISLFIIVLDKLGIGMMNVLVRVNPFIKLLLHYHYSLGVNKMLQKKEPSSIYIHFSAVSYFIYFLCFLLVGLFIDFIRNGAIKSKL